MGISKSTYEIFTVKRLGLTGKNTYVVFRQVDSDKAHPIDYATIGEMAARFETAYKNAGYFEMLEVFRTYMIQGYECKIFLVILEKDIMKISLCFLMNISKR